MSEQARAGGRVTPTLDPERVADSWRRTTLSDLMLLVLAIAVGFQITRWIDRRFSTAGVVLMLFFALIVLGPMLAISQYRRGRRVPPSTGEAAWLGQSSICGLLALLIRIQGASWFPIVACETSLTLLTVAIIHRGLMTEPRKVLDRWTSALGIVLGTVPGGLIACLYLLGLLH